MSELLKLERTVVDISSSVLDDYLQWMSPLVPMCVLFFFTDCPLPDAPDNVTQTWDLSPNVTSDRVPVGTNITFLCSNITATLSSNSSSQTLVCEAGGWSIPLEPCGEWSAGTPPMPSGHRPQVNGCGAPVAEWPPGLTARAGQGNHLGIRGGR